MSRFAAVVLVALLVGCAPPPSWQRKTLAYDLSRPMGAYVVYRPKDSPAGHPAVVFFHGGAFRSGDKSEAALFADDLCPHGYIVVSPNYRLSAPDARWPAQLEDAWAALRSIRANADALGIVGPLAVMGSSAGGMLAMLVHLRDDPLDPGHRPCCCVDISGEMDLTLGEQCFWDWPEIMGRLVGLAPYDPAVLRAMSPIAYARRDAHVLMLHSSMDTNVYVENADRMAKALAGADLTYCRFVGYAHGDNVWTTSAPGRGEAYTFLARQLLHR